MGGKYEFDEMREKFFGDGMPGHMRKYDQYLHHAGSSFTFWVNCGEKFAFCWGTTTLAIIDRENNWEIMPDRVKYRSMGWSNGNYTKLNEEHWERNGFSQGERSRIYSHTPVHDLRRIDGVPYIYDRDGKRSYYYHGIMLNSDGRVISESNPEMITAYDDTTKKERSRKNETRRAVYARTKSERKIIGLLKEDNTAKLEKAIASDFFFLQNVALRTKFIERVGMEKIVDLCGFENVDKDSKHGYELIDVAMGKIDFMVRSGRSNERFPYLKMTNPSTGEVCIEGVGQNCKTVKEALEFRNSGLKGFPQTLT